jgi:peptidoglycan/xylan/chitin deacetylase (PgdA/CDA1 family)
MTQLMTVFLVTLIIGLPWAAAADKFEGALKPVKPVERVETKQQLVAITFDDGPHAVNTPKLLELFKKNNAKATFFVVGKNVRKHPELAKRMQAEGHELGNHTTTHADLAKLGDLKKVRKEIEDTQKILTETIGKPALVFRAPFLSHDKNVWTVLKDMPSINASRLTTDWRGDCTAQSIFEQATQDTKAGDTVLSAQNLSLQKVAWAAVQAVPVPRKKRK